MDAECRSQGTARLRPARGELYPWMRVKHAVGYTAAFYPKWDYTWSVLILDRWELSATTASGPSPPDSCRNSCSSCPPGHHPELLILDEPVASLDPIARREFLRTLLDIAQDERHTVLFSTHITSDLDRVASHAALAQGWKNHLLRGTRHPQGSDQTTPDHLVRSFLMGIHLRRPQNRSLRLSCHYGLQRLRRPHRTTPTGPRRTDLRRKPQPGRNLPRIARGQVVEVRFHKVRRGHINHA